MKSLLILFLFFTSCLIAAESKILIAPAHIYLPGQELPESELKDFYQTQSELISSEKLRKRVANKIQTVQNPTIVVDRVPETSILTVKVTGLGEQNEKYLDTLIDEFIAYKKEMTALAVAEATKKIKDQIEKSNDTKLINSLKQKISVLEAEAEINADVINRLN